MWRPVKGVPVKALWQESIFKFIVGNFRCIVLQCLEFQVLSRLANRQMHVGTHDLRAVSLSALKR